jgi:hypothetical protein
MDADMEMYEEELRAVRYVLAAHDFQIQVVPTILN